MREEAGHWEGWIAEVNQHVLDLVRPSLDDEAFERAWADGSRLSVDDALALASASTR
jgi:hypothetical protein